MWDSHRHCQDTVLDTGSAWDRGQPLHGVHPGHCRDSVGTAPGPPGQAMAPELCWPGGARGGRRGKNCLCLPVPSACWAPRQPCRGPITQPAQAPPHAAGQGPSEANAAGLVTVHPSDPPFPMLHMTSRIWGSRPALLLWVLVGRRSCCPEELPWAHVLPQPQKHSCSPTGGV